jgi:hypothetical protein
MGEAEDASEAPGAVETERLVSESEKMLSGHRRERDEDEAE